MLTCSTCGAALPWQHLAGTNLKCLMCWDAANPTRYVASCHGCRQTWDGGVAPASMMCPDCGEQLEVEPE